MGTKMGKRVVLFGMLTACCAAFLINGCSEKAGGTKWPNLPPDTHISYGPAEDSLTFYRIQIFPLNILDDAQLEHVTVGNNTTYGGNLLDVG